MTTDPLDRLLADQPPPRAGRTGHDWPRHRARARARRRRRGRRGATTTTTTNSGRDRAAGTT